MKFKSPSDIPLFLAEVGRLDLLNSPVEQFPVELDELFIRGRRSFIPKLKDFRASQNAKANWRKSRYKNMRGIRAWHKSTAGKRFHRAMGRYLATRNPVSRTSGASESFMDGWEFLKALSSLKTHYWIEHGYYRSVEEEIDLQEFGEELLPVIARVEECLLQTRKMSEDDADFLLAIIHPNDLQCEIAELAFVEVGKVREASARFFGTRDMTEAGAFLALTRDILSAVSVDSKVGNP